MKFPSLGGLPNPDVQRLHPGWLGGLGALLALLGVASLVFPFAATLAFDLAVGVTLVLAGISQTGFAFRVRPDSGWVSTLATGILTGVAGLCMLAFPFPSVFALTLVLVVSLAASGGVRIASSTRRPRGRGAKWTLASGVLSVLLAALILFGLPRSAYWVLGTILGVDLLLHGTGLMMQAWMRQDEGAPERDGSEVSTVEQAPAAPTRTSDQSRLEEALWESFPASDPPGFGR